MLELAGLDSSDGEISTRGTFRKCSEGIRIWEEIENCKYAALWLTINPVPTLV